MGYVPKGRWNTQLNCLKSHQIVTQLNCLEPHPNSNSLPVLSGLMHRTPLQPLIFQKLLTFSFTIWLGVFQRSWTLYFTLVATYIGRYCTVSTLSDYINAVVMNIFMNAPPSLYKKQSTSSMKLGQAKHTDNFKGIYCPAYSFYINYHMHNFHFQSQ